MRHKPIRELAMITMGRVANLLGAVASLKLLTVHLTVEEFGRFGLALAGANALAMLMFSAFGAGMFRFTSPLVESGQHSRLRHLFMVHLTRISLLVLIVSAILISLQREIWPGVPWSLIFLTLVASVLLGWRLVSFNSIQAMRVRGTAAILQAVAGLSRGLVAVPFILMFAPTAEWAMIGVVVFLFLLVAVQMVMVSRLIIVPAQQATDDQPLSIENEESFSQFCKPLVAVFALTMFTTYSDRFLVARLLTLTDTAVLVAFLQIARSVSIMSVGITIQFVYPIVFAGLDRSDALKQRRYRQIWTAWLAVVGAIGGLSLAIAVVAEPVVRFLTTDDYAPFAPLLPFLVIAVALPQVARILEAHGMHVYSTNRYVLPKVSEATTMVMILLLAIPWLGVYGVPLAYAASGLVLNFGYFIVNQRTQE